MRNSVVANNLKQSYLAKGIGKEAILFIHGNGSSSVFWKETISSLSSEFMCIAPDLRGFGGTQPIPARAHRSFGDYVDDLKELMIALGVEKYHIVSHSLGGGITWEMLCKNPDSIKSAILVNPASPFGFGGTKNESGELTFSDAAGSGGGIVNPEFVELIKKKDRTTDHVSSPLNVMNAFYWNPELAPKNTDELLDSLLSMKIGETFYPGDFKPSKNFPYVAPGEFGQLNCASPMGKSEMVQNLLELSSKPPLLWLRGGKDQIVSNSSMFDTATHGIAGLIPDYPGAEICPQQPMVDQTRYVLNKYENLGGTYQEVVFEKSGHSPFLEEPERFINTLTSWISKF